MAAALAVFAVLVTTYIFIPTYIRRANDELHELLLQQAETDSTRESLSRALLLSISGEPDQDRAAARAISTVAREADDILGPLLTSGARETFCSELEQLTRDAMRLWRRAQRSIVRCEASLEETDIGKWRNLPLPSRPHNSAPSAAAAATDLSQDEVVLALFPSVFTVRENEWETIFSGIVLRSSQIAAAEREWKDNMPRPGGVTSTRSGQSKRNRRTSVVDGQGGIIRSPTDRSFLGQVY